MIPHSKASKFITQRCMHMQMYMIVCFIDAILESVAVEKLNKAPSSKTGDVKKSKPSI